MAVQMKGSADDLVLKVNKSEYDGTISKLDGYIDELKDIASEYETQKNRVNEFYSGQETKELQKAVQKNIETVYKAIAYAEGQRNSIKAMLDKKQATENTMADAIQGAIQVAERVISL